jgi:hypothetical protein
MVFRVEIAPQAFDDLDRIAAHIAAESSFAVRPEKHGSWLVQVFHVRHWARHAVSSHELQDLMGI